MDYSFALESMLQKLDGSDGKSCSLLDLLFIFVLGLIFGRMNPHYEINEKL